MWQQKTEKPNRYSQPSELLIIIHTDSRSVTFKFHQSNQEYLLQVWRKGGTFIYPHILQERI